MQWVIATAALALVVGGVIAEPAAANWQYSRWGMTLAELQAASPAVRSLNAKQAKAASVPVIGEALAESAYETKDFKFRATFLFKAGGLVAVYLKPLRDSEYPKVEHMLGQVYGTPAKAADKPWLGDNCREVSKEWLDGSSGTLVTMMATYCIPPVQSFFSLIYRPVLSKEATGL